MILIDLADRLLEQTVAVIATPPDRQVIYPNEPPQDCVEVAAWAGPISLLPGQRQIAATAMGGPRHVLTSIGAGVHVVRCASSSASTGEWPPTPESMRADYEQLELDALALATTIVPSAMDWSLFGDFMGKSPLNVGPVDFLLSKGGLRGVRWTMDIRTGL